MKALVMTLIFAATSMVNAFSANNEKEFVYNCKMEGEQMTSQTVYKVSNEKFLKNHLQYNFAYDAQNRIMRKEVMKWSETTGSFEKHYCLNYTYTNDEVNVEYALWNEKSDQYTNAKMKAVYRPEGELLSYQSYRWDAQEHNWNLVVEHATTATGWDVELLAIN